MLRQVLAAGVLEVVYFSLSAANETVMQQPISKNIIAVGGKVKEYPHSTSHKNSKNSLRSKAKTWGRAGLQAVMPVEE